MNILAIVITNAIGITLCIILLFCSALSRRNTSNINRLFTVMMYIVASGCLMEAISYIVDGHTEPVCRFLTVFSNTWLYFFNVTFSLLWCLYVDYHLYRSRTRLLTVYRPMMILTVCLQIIILGNLFGHYLFSIDTSNVYRREPLSYAFFIIPILYVLQSTYTVFHYKHTGHSVQFFPIMAFLLPFFVGCIIQCLVYGISLAWCSTAIGITALYMCSQNEQVFKDPLTRLLNRHYLNTVLKDGNWNHRNPFSGVMLDVDYFKSINDTYGHAKGDEALCDVADILCENIPVTGAAIRYAGDEFVLLLRTVKNDEICAVEEQIASAIQHFNETAGRVYTLSLSMGHGIFTPGRSTQDTFLEEIDLNMYEQKRRRHQSGELQDRRH